MTDAVQFDDASAKLVIFPFRRVAFDTCRLQLVIYRKDRHGSRQLMTLQPGEVLPEYEAVSPLLTDDEALFPVIGNEEAERLYEELTRCGIAPDAQSLRARLKFAEEIALRQAGSLGQRERKQE